MPRAAKRCLGSGSPSQPTSVHCQRMQVALQVGKPKPRYRRYLASGGSAQICRASVQGKATPFPSRASEKLVTCQAGMSRAAHGLQSGPVLRGSPWPGLPQRSRHSGPPHPGRPAARPCSCAPGHPPCCHMPAHWSLTHGEACMLQWSASGQVAARCAGPTPKPASWPLHPGRLAACVRFSVPGYSPCCRMPAHWRSDHVQSRMSQAPLRQDRFRPGMPCTLSCVLWTAPSRLSGCSHTLLCTWAPSLLFKACTSMISLRPGRPGILDRVRTDCSQACQALLTLYF